MVNGAILIYWLTLIPISTIAALKRDWPTISVDLDGSHYGKRRRSLSVKRSSWRGAGNAESSAAAENRAGKHAWTSWIGTREPALCRAMAQPVRALHVKSSAPMALVCAALKNDRGARQLFAFGGQSPAPMHRRGGYNEVRPHGAIKNKTPAAMRNCRECSLLWYPPNDIRLQGRSDVSESVYKVLELVGTSTQSWELAAKAAVERAALTLRDLRVAEVVEQDLVIEDGKVEAYRTKLKVSFKFEG